MEQSLKLTPHTGIIPCGSSTSFECFLSHANLLNTNKIVKWSFLYILQQEALSLTSCIGYIENF
jgi:hypothetical protein